MDYKEQIDKRINMAVLDMTSYLQNALNKSSKKATVELAELIKALTEGIANLMPYVTEQNKEKKKEKDNEK